jgi:colanic acid biosynthesis glycosyl transferase WcaI
VVRAIELSCGFARYSAVVRLRQELQYARISARAILAARPDVAVLSNIPLLSLFILTLSLRMRRVPYVFWQQDIYSEAIRVIARDRFGWLGHLIGWVARRVERQVARGAAAIVAISETFIEQLDAWESRQARYTWYRTGPRSTRCPCDRETMPGQRLTAWWACPS